MLAVQQSAFDWHLEALRRASAGQRDSGAKLRAAVEVTLGFASARPEEARLLLIETVGGDRELALRILDHYQRIATLMRAECKARAGGIPLPGLTEQALVGAAASLIGTRIATGRVNELAELEQELVEFLLLPYSGGHPQAAG
ncbi:MAG: hypothetical protein QOE75_971 [Solirubrobacterales bacterium]|jgi:hypothetical protein|nr:hypothetical protein [Solirubrobacterales bacterium]